MRAGKKQTNWVPAVKHGDGPLAIDKGEGRDPAPHALGQLDQDLCARVSLELGQRRRQLALLGGRGRRRRRCSGLGGLGLGLVGGVLLGGGVVGRHLVFFFWAGFRGKKWRHFAGLRNR